MFRSRQVQILHFDFEQIWILRWGPGCESLLQNHQAQLKNNILIIKWTELFHISQLPAWAEFYKIKWSSFKGRFLVLQGENLQIHNFLLYRQTTKGTKRTFKSNRNWLSHKWVSVFVSPSTVPVASACGVWQFSPVCLLHGGMTSIFKTQLSVIFYKHHIWKLDSSVEFNLLC